MNKALSILTRYSLIILMGIGNLFLIYKIFYPLTFFSSTFILSLFGNVKSIYSVNLFMFNTTAIEIVDACVAGSAYFLLWILALSIQNINLKKRIYLISYLFSSLLLVNVLRIVLMTLIAETKYFDMVHLFLWYGVSLVIVVGIWFSAVKIFKIKEIPVYDDVIYLINEAKGDKRKKKNSNSRKNNSKRNR